MRFPLTVAQGQKVQLTIIDLDIEPGSQGCPYDYLKVYDGTTLLTVSEN